MSIDPNGESLILLAITVVSLVVVATPFVVSVAETEKAMSGYSGWVDLDPAMGLYAAPVQAASDWVYAFIDYPIHSTKEMIEAVKDIKRMKEEKKQKTQAAPQCTVKTGSETAQKASIEYRPWNLDPEATRYILYGTDNNAKCLRDSWNAACQTNWDYEKKVKMFEVLAKKARAYLNMK